MIFAFGEIVPISTDLYFTFCSLNTHTQIYMYIVMNMIVVITELNEHHG